MSTIWLKQAHGWIKNARPNQEHKMNYTFTVIIGLTIKQMKTTTILNYSNTLALSNSVFSPH